MQMYSNILLDTKLILTGLEGNAQGCLYAYTRLIYAGVYAYIYAYIGFCIRVYIRRITAYIRVYAYNRNYRVYL
jgi:hypothetical protein